MSKLSHPFFLIVASQFYESDQDWTCQKCGKRWPGYKWSYGYEYETDQGKAMFKPKYYKTLSKG